MQYGPPDWDLTGLLALDRVPYKFHVQSAPISGTVSTSRPASSLVLSRPSSNQGPSQRFSSFDRPENNWRGNPNVSLESISQLRLEKEGVGSPRMERYMQFQIFEFSIGANSSEFILSTYAGQNERLDSLPAPSESFLARFHLFLHAAMQLAGWTRRLRSLARSVVDPQTRRQQRARKKRKEQIRLCRG